MSKKNWLIALLVAWPLAALAENQEQLVERYTALAGSKQNATALVTGLRDGKEITLTNGTTTETITPPTAKMGYGNVDHALALAEASLAKQGVQNPTFAQLEAALVGANGVDGVLAMRAAGQGWGQIAHSLGFKLGDVKRADKAPERVATVERAQRPEKPERPQKPERPEKPGRPR